MIGSVGDMMVFWSNGLVGSITTIAIILLFWPVIDKAFSVVKRRLQPTEVTKDRQRAWALMKEAVN